MREPAPTTDRKPGKIPPRFTLPLFWTAATVLLAVFFIVAAVPRAQAQSADDERRYTLIIQNVYDFIQRHYVDEVDAEKLYEGAMKGMFEALGDPYSVFLPRSDMEDLNDTTQGSFGGVGLYITKPLAQKGGEPPYVEVASPIEDTPGWRAGISPGDLILSIDGTSTDKLSMDEVLSKLRGKPGTDVTIQIRRGEKLEFPVKLNRAVIEVPTVKHSMIGNDVGYVRIITFTPMTAERVQAAIESFQKAGYKSVIVDLRNNYGGLLQAAISVSGYFLDGGVVVSTKSRLPGENAVFNTKTKLMVPKDFPVVVMINRGSASASEIVAGALKDRGRAYLVGEKSFGKGSVQQVYPIDESGFKITTSRYYTPSDVNIDKIGIPPDLEVKFPALTESEETGLNKLIADNKVPAFVKANPQHEPAKIDAFVRASMADYNLGETLMRRLVRDEINRTVIAPVYDLDFDVQLKAAVDLIRDGSYASRMKTVKTLKALQDEASASTAAAKDDSASAKSGKAVQKK